MAGTSGRSCDASALEDPARFGDECRDSKTDPILQFGPDGKVVKSFGGGMFIWPHGLDVDQQGNVWVTDAVATQPHPERRQARADRRQVQPRRESAADARHAGSGGQRSGSLHLAERCRGRGKRRCLCRRRSRRDRQQSDREIFKDGKFVTAWGKSGWAPGEFHSIHAIAIDSRGRVFVGDRGNNRIQIFDQDGKSLTTPWTQFGKPSGIAFDSKDQIYVADSESDDVQNPGWEEGIRIGDAKSGWINAFILFPWGDPRQTAGNGAEFVAVDRDGNIYGGEPAPKRLQKYVRVRP